MNESELYKELGVLTKDRNQWEEKIPYVASLLNSESIKIQAKALWLLGEMGLVYPLSVQDAVPVIASFCDSPEPLLRERAVNALGRIGRGSYQVIEAYWADLFRFASDAEAKVRLSFIWASENIAVNKPEPYGPYMPVFAELLHDSDDKVRMEAPEIFRVLGKRKPEFVQPYLEELWELSETDSNRVVRIHCLGAIKAVTGTKKWDTEIRPYYPKFIVYCGLDPVLTARPVKPVWQPCHFALGRREHQLHPILKKKELDLLPIY